MTGSITGHGGHHAVVSTYTIPPDSFVYADWRCICGDRQTGYLKRRYAEDDARLHVEAMRRQA